MADIELTEAEANILMKMEKRAADQKEYSFPLPGERLVIPLTSLDGRQDFLLDITRSRIKVIKASYQNRARGSIVLYRLDLNGAPHRNPDGTELPCPHLHVYKEGFADKWAVPAPTQDFPDVLNLPAAFDDFMRYCKVTEPPLIKRRLF